MSLLSKILRVVTWWNGGTLTTVLYTRRHGVKAGEDDQGNIYYESKDGKKRWVVFNGEVEASRISPDWHGWLHHTFDQKPGSADALEHKSWEKPHQENLTGSVLAYVPAGSQRAAAPAERRDYEAWSPE